MANKQIIKILVQNNLKVTPQRVAVLETIMTLKTHPSADIILNYLRITHPHISIGTIYNILETFVKKGILQKVKTDNDVMRYDEVTSRHHHLYCSESERIEDYNDETLDQIIAEYFKTKKISNFKIEDFKLQIVGSFLKENK